MIRKWALQNAVKYGGKANPGAVIGKLLSEQPELKEQMKDLAKQVNIIIKDVNALKPEQQLAELKKTAPELLEEKKKEEKHELPELQNAVVGNVVTAFPPEPSGYPHLGHGKGALVNYLYAKKYQGKFILRFEDTNPELATQEFIDAILEGIKWLGIEWDELVYISDTIPAIYQKGGELLNKGVFYACACEPEAMKRNRLSSTVCEHREHAVDVNTKFWKEMLDGVHDKGDVVIRWKADLEHKNTAMRDPTMFRIIKLPHVRHGTKYHVWPSYDCAAAFSDGAEGITHRVRSKEFELRAEVQSNLQKLMGFRPTVIVEQARFNLEGVEASKRKIREGIREGTLTGWDDIRLSTIIALRRRGFVPEALRNFLISLGVTKHESTITWDMISAENRKVLDPVANRAFFIPEPVKITIEGAPEKIAEVDVHPDHPERGTRKFKTHSEFYVAPEDVREFKQRSLYRLMDCFNFTKTAKGYKFHSLDVETYREKGKRILHWLPADAELVNVELVMPDASVRKGLGEPALKNLKEGDILQFQRVGFVRLDKKEKDKLVFWFAHR